MKITSIADKLMRFMARKVVDTGHDYFDLDSLAEEFPSIPRHQIILAIEMLRSDGMLSARYYDDEPSIIKLNVNSIRNKEEDTLVKKGYTFVKEVRQWF